MLDALAEYRAQLTNLEGKLGLLGPLRDAVADAKENLEQREEDAATAAENAVQDRDAALSLRAKAEAARAALTQEAQNHPSEQLSKIVVHARGCAITAGLRAALARPIGRGGYVE